MKITLISPYATIEAIGPRTLSACLKKAGHCVQILFLHKEFIQKYSSSTMNEMSDLLRDSDLIGISIISNYFDNVLQITDQLKKTVRAPIVWGGVHPTIRPEECLKYVDIICRGEAEAPLVELADKIQRGQDYRDVKNMWFNDQGKIIRNGMNPINKNLDSIPLPDYDYEDHFVLHKDKIERMDLRLTEKYLGRHDRDYMILATRGCSFGCTYCCHNFFINMDGDNRLVRKRSPANLIQELLKAKEKMPYIRSIKFSDDAFFFYSEKEILEFCDAYKRHIKLPLRIKGINPRTCNQTKLAMLVDAGLDSLRVGLQSGSEQTKAFYKRKDSNEKMLEVVNMINGFRARVPDVQYDIILDNPWEAEEDLIRTLKMLVRFKPPFYLALFSLTFYPETELYYKAKRDGLIKDDLNDVYRKYYRETRKTYINGLFHLVNAYALQRQQLPPILMDLLTLRVGRRLGISYLLYGSLLVERKVYRILQLSCKGLRDLSRGDSKRFALWFRKTFKAAS